MSIRVFLTSDLHLGMKFAGYPEAVRAALMEARFSCLDRVVAAANETRSDLLVVAGDLFETVSVARRDVQRAAKSLAAFRGRLAAVMPGNHDYISGTTSSGRLSRTRQGTSCSCWNPRGRIRLPGMTWMRACTRGPARQSIPRAMPSGGFAGLPGTRPSVIISGLRTAAWKAFPWTRRACTTPCGRRSFWTPE